MSDRLQRILANKARLEAQLAEKERANQLATQKTAPAPISSPDSNPTIRAPISALKIQKDPEQILESVRKECWAKTEQGWATSDPAHLIAHDSSSSNESHSYNVSLIGSTLDVIIPDLGLHLIFRSVMDESRPRFWRAEDFLLATSFLRLFVSQSFDPWSESISKMTLAMSEICILSTIQGINASILDLRHFESVMELLEMYSAKLQDAVERLKRNNLKTHRDAVSRWRSNLEETLSRTWLSRAKLQIHDLTTNRGVSEDLPALQLFNTGSFPTELLFAIFDLLDPLDLFRIALVCRHWHIWSHEERFSERMLEMIPEMSTELGNIRLNPARISQGLPDPLPGVPHSKR
eukprot:TRINITY_DN2568_c0_g1_i3.p1 TRINITY_DN2568_c0_g1~~TRINITY_DN2568_c0_g1_i3.p1  ORF type:complete len:356 (+),score=60.97 TRINITY_DN2568_c0_g1_i3:23-1069(+)